MRVADEAKPRIASSRGSHRPLFTILNCMNFAIRIGAHPNSAIVVERYNFALKAEFCYWQPVLTD